VSQVYFVFVFVFVFAEAYGRHRRAIHEFPDFKHQSLTILEWRKALRKALKAPLLEIVKAASRRLEPLPCQVPRLVLDDDSDESWQHVGGTSTCSAIPF
jgi:hypothetical protein